MSLAILTGIFYALLSQGNKAGFIDCETALNRSHDDGFRITANVSAKDKILYRLDSIERIWKADSRYVQDYESDIARVEGQLLLQLAKYHFLDSDTKGTRQAVKDYWAKGVKAGRGHSYCPVSSGRQ